MEEKIILTAIVLAKNEEKNIADCLEALSFCDEIVVIVDTSTDKTKEIAEKMGAAVVLHPLHGDFSNQRNFGLEQATGEWVFFVDADERVSKELQKEILSITKQTNSVDGYFVQRFDFMKGKMLTHGETGEITLLRLGKKDAGKWKGSVHEVWDIQGQTAMLTSPLLHYPHQTIEEFLQEINFYTDVRALELYKKGIHVSWFSIAAYPFGKIIYNYCIKRGFLDGTEGIIMALMMSFHSFLVRGKLWQLWDQKQ